MEVATTNQNQILKSYTNNNKQDIILSALDNQRIKNYAGLGEIAQTLFKLYIVTGLNADRHPDENLESVLVQFISKNYQNYTLQEVELAFELAMTRDILPFMGKNAEVSHFQNFSIEYFCKIMTGYRKYKEHSMKPILAKQNKMKQAEPISDHDFLKLNFVNKFKIYEQGGYPWSYGIDVTIFNALIRIGKVNLSKEIKVKAGQDVKKSMGINGDIDDKTKNEWIKKTKIKCFQILINELRVNKTNLDELIKKV